jgi:FkbM family methyltransferase
VRLLKASVYGALHAAGRSLGQQRAERLGRTLHRGLRLMSDNDIDRNGEGLVMDVALDLQTGGSEVFDVGANAGQWASHFLAKREARARGDVRLHCFEPSAATFRLLESNPVLARSTSVHRVNAGLSSDERFAELGIVHEGAGSNSIHNYAVIERERISLQTLDGYASSNAVERIALMKLDVEGHEIDVLEGARAMLSTERIDLIQFEYTWRWIDAHRYLRDAFGILGPYGFHIHRISEYGLQPLDCWNPDLENFWETNLLAVGPRVLHEPSLRARLIK